MAMDWDMEDVNMDLMGNPYNAKDAFEVMDFPASPLSARGQRQLHWAYSHLRNEHEKKRNRRCTLEIFQEQFADCTGDNKSSLLAIDDDDKELLEPFPAPKSRIPVYSPGISRYPNKTNTKLKVPSFPQSKLVRPTQLKIPAKPVVKRTRNEELTVPRKRLQTSLPPPKSLAIPKLKSPLEYSKFYGNTITIAHSKISPSYHPILENLYLKCEYIFIMLHHPLPKHQWLVNEAAIAAITNADNPGNHNSKLELAELEQVHKVFLFYDSSFHDDKLPSINLARFFEILKDTHMLASNFTETQAEEIFAAAMLGKLRTYLDADGAPALTFKLFCGALMQIATIKFPGISPSLALRKLVRRHLFPLYNELVGSTSLLESSRHQLSIAAALNDVYWRPYDSQGESKLNSRRVCQSVYERVVEQILPPTNLATLVNDIPDELKMQFSKEDYDLIVNRFHLFDHNDHGMIDHEDVFVFIHGLAEKINIHNVNHVVERLTSFASNKITLEFILKVIFAHTQRDLNTSDSQDAGVHEQEDESAVVLTREDPESLSIDTNDSEFTSQHTLLNYSLDVPEDQWDKHNDRGQELKEIHAEAMLPSRFDAKTVDSVIKRITITNTSEKKARQKNHAAQQAQRILLSIEDEATGTTKFWEGRIRGFRVIECAGVVHGSEYRVVTEANTRMNSEESCKLLLHHRVRARIKSGYVVVEGRRFLPDDAKVTKPIVVAFKKGSLDKSSTIVHSTPELPTYLPSHHRALYQLPPYSVPDEWVPPATHLSRDSSWVQEGFPRILKSAGQSSSIQHRVQGRDYQRRIQKHHYIRPFSEPTPHSRAPL
ncbi:hypothetical protein THRCLA_07394 [Thraustotheca clavata]|uniref:EF-hand domain-containing protein n=1 Tax=Thraustotheca clavata TaxID=74557 RepID=A0A1V9ZDH8_9STRA|nr:hypothetical protein THRCLA_07394 [Thraustotheca clavata]